MDYTLPEELQTIKQVVREFINERVIPAENQIEAEDRVPQALLDEAKRMGLFGIRIPEEYGGLGMGVLGQSAIFEEIGRGSHGFSGVVGAHTGIGTSGIVELGSEEIKRKYLPDMAEGRRIGCFALTEPQAGSDASQIRTSAVKKGDKYILNGEKIYITNAPLADLFTVIAVTDPKVGARGISAFVVERDFPGLSVGPPEKKMGLHGSATAAVLFEDCEVPAGNILGPEGTGYVAAMKILTKGRATLAARCVGGMERCLEESIKWSRQRITMGKPIAEHQMIQAYLAEMATDIAASRAFVYEVAWKSDQGANIQKEAAMVKLFVTEAFARVADKAVQIHGGMGYMKETPVERLYRDARITRIYEGTSEIQKLIIAGKLLQD